MIERVAQWTIYPFAEREIGRERRERIAARRAGWAFAFSGLVLWPLSGLGVLAGLLGRGPSASSTLVVACLFITIGLGCEHMRRSARAWKLRDALTAEMREEYRPTAGWIVELTVFQGAAPTGKDQGAVWFEDDRLYFSGTRTSFGIAADEAGGTRRARRIAGLQSPLTLLLKANGPGGPVSLGFDFEPHSVGIMPGPLREAAFDHEIRRWRERGGGITGGGQLPPLVPGPDAPSARRLLVRALLSGVTWALATVIVGIGLVGGGLIGVVFALLLVGMPLAFGHEVWAPWQRFAAWWDRRRLDWEHP